VQHVAKLGTNLLGGVAKVYCDCRTAIVLLSFHLDGQELVLDFFVTAVDAGDVYTVIDLLVKEFELRVWVVDLAQDDFVH